MVSIATTARPSNATDDERLLKLFRNRAELKQEFAELRRREEQLKDQIKKQEGKLLRLQQRFDQLEGVLSDPDQAATIIVFYQLRGIWLGCGRLLKRLANELAENQYKREQQLSAESFEDMKAASAAELSRQALRAKQRLGEVEREIAELQAAFEARFWLTKWLKRKQYETECDAAMAKLDVARSQFELRAAKLKKKTAERAPELDGLSVPGKRKINLALIAIAQEYFLHYNKSNVASLAREASVRQAVDVSYGEPGRCRELSAYIDGRVKSLPGGDELLNRVKRRAKYLQSGAHYRSNADVTPAAESFAMVPVEVNDEGIPVDGKMVATNILAEEYWEIYSALLS